MLRTKPARLLFLLVLLILALLALATTPGPMQRSQQFIVHADTPLPPEVIAPEGELKEAFDLARPASLKIEVRGRLRNSLRSRVIGVGSGFFVSADGLLLTAYHVVDSSGTGANLRYVALGPAGEEYELELVGFDAYLDLAVLRADVDTEVPYIPLAEASPRIGSGIVAIGNSRDEFLQGRAGRITRFGVDAARADFADDTIELTAALAPGDSGGPVLNARGEAIGVVSYISFAPEGMSSNRDRFIPPYLRGLVLPNRFASYAVPVTLEKGIVEELQVGLKRDVPVIGFSGGNDYVPSASSVDLGPLPGAIVSFVQPGSPAERAGLRGVQDRLVRDAQGNIIGRDISADVIVAVDGEKTAGFYELLEVVRRKQIGEAVTLTVQRDGETVFLELELGAKRNVFN